MLDEPDFDEVLLDWLADLDDASLARVLSNRPEVLDPPWPRRLENVVRRMSEPDSVVLAMRGLTRPGFQVLRAIRMVVALRGVGSAGIDEVAHWLGASVDDVAPMVEQLADRALAWPEAGGRLRTPPSHNVIGLDLAGLGPSITEYLPQRTVQDLKTMCSALGVGGDGRKTEIVDRMLAFFRDPAGIAALLADAPDGTSELLTEFAWHGPERECESRDGYYSYRERRPESPEQWACKRGLLWRGYETAVMPLEVGLAIRGPGYRLPFEPRSPEPAVTPVSAEQVSAAASTAALRMVDRICAVLDHAAGQPIPLLKTGRVGARAVKAVAGATGSTVEEVRLAVDLAIAMLLLAPVEEEPEPPAFRRGRAPLIPPKPLPPPGLVPSDRLAVWRGAGTADRLRMALDTWWASPCAPLGNEKTVRSVLGDGPSAAFTDVRQLTVRLLTQLPAGAGASDEASLADLVGWHAPLLSSVLLEALVSATLAESARLGVTAFGAPGELARALLAATAWHGGPAEANHPDLVQATDRLAAGARTTALFGADLTAVVTGAPDAALAGLLDKVADRESVGAASTWRFGPTSVRRALDTGMTAAALLDNLRAVASKPLPQPLEYLINDVDRRHGEVGVLATSCVVVGAEPLVAEIAVHRKLASLGLRSVAPTVLVTGATAEDTIAALRAAGYAPVRQNDEGTLKVQPAAAIPADLAELVERPVPVAQDPLEHAARLLRTPVRAPGPTLRRGTLLNVLYRERGERLTYDWTRFAWHLESGVPTRVEYLERDGGHRELVISDPELHDDTIDVWCEEIAEYRRLELARVRPAV